MKLVTFATTLLFVIPFTQGIAVSKPTPLPRVCERRGNKLAATLYTQRMRLPFLEKGGLLDRGVCWWHSRFQRAVWHLAEFAPKEQRPSRTAAKKIIRQIAQFQQVVKIPGYSDFHSFALDHKELIHIELERWQLFDAPFVWPEGLSGEFEEKDQPERADRLLEKLFAKVLENKAKDRVTWVMLQMPGITSHAALVLDMKRIKNELFELHVVDSNRPGKTRRWKYTAGSGVLETYDPSLNPTLPYVNFNRDYNRIEKALTDYCGARI